MTDPTAILHDDNITDFIEYLANLSGSSVVVLEDPSATNAMLGLPTGSIVVIPHGVQLIRDFPPLGSSLRELSKIVHKIVIVDDIDSFLDISEISGLVQKHALPLEFLGYNKDIYGITRYISILSNIQPDPSNTAPEEFRVVALISTFNEIDIIERVIDHLTNNHIGVYVIDNWSTDGTYEFIQQLPHPGILGSERWPASGPIDTYDWTGILRRKEALAGEIDADWFIHHDADEIRESPWTGIDLKEAFYFVDHSGYSAIDFTVLDFQPVNNTYQPGSSLEAHFHYFGFGVQSADFQQVKAWKKTLDPIDLCTTGGHTVNFPEKRVFPYKFLLKHYPIRSQAHGERKVLKERISRWSESERNLGWHTQYEQLAARKSYLKNPKGLLLFDHNFHTDFLLERLSGIGIRMAAKKDQKIELLNSQLFQTSEENRALAIERADLEREVIAYATSTSWKATRPFRKLRKLVGKK